MRACGITTDTERRPGGRRVCVSQGDAQLHDIWPRLSHDCVPVVLQVFCHLIVKVLTKGLLILGRHAGIRIRSELHGINDYLGKLGPLRIGIDINQRGLTFFARL